MNYKKLLTDGYSQVIDDLDACVETRMEYLSTYIFDFTTYDGDIDELFAKYAIEVMRAIQKKATFEYIEDPERYKWYLLMCNMPFFKNRIDWGGSVRGAWWTIGDMPKIDSCGLYLDGEQVLTPLEFTDESWREFVDAVLWFACSKEST